MVRFAPPFPKLLQWLSLSAATFFLLIGLNQPAIAGTPKDYDQIQFPPLKEVSIPNYDRYTLDNGMVVYLLEDHKLPLVRGSAMIKTGSRWEPADKIGLAEITGSVMRTGGTTNHSGDELNELLEQKAATIETAINNNSGEASFNVLSEDLPLVFDLFAEIIQEPRFDQSKIDLTKNQIKGGIARRNDDPGDIASREFYKKIYGETSPYARTIEYSTLDAISRDDVVSFYQGNIQPQNIILGIVGDFNPAQMKALIAANFGDWQGSTSTTNTNVPAASQAYRNDLFLVDQPQLTQSNILLGHLGGALKDPDYPSLSVINGVLNGFGGRLFNEIRSRQGLAYSVYGYWSPQYDYPGVFIAGGQTRSEATLPFLQSLLTEIKNLRENPISEAELDYAKESILNSFVFKFQSPGQTLARIVNYEYYGYPQDFIFDYQRGIKATTIADVQNAAQTYLQPEQLVTVVVGNGAEIREPLQAINPNVQTIDVTIPGL